MILKEAITSYKYARSNFRLNNDACHEKIRNLILSISHLDPIENRNGQKQYDELTQFISVVFNEVYPLEEIRKK